MGAPLGIPLGNIQGIEGQQSVETTQEVGLVPPLTLPIPSPVAPTTMETPATSLDALPVTEGSTLHQGLKSDPRSSNLAVVSNPPVLSPKATTPAAAKPQIVAERRAFFEKKPLADQKVKPDAGQVPAKKRVDYALVEGEKTNIRSLISQGNKKEIANLFNAAMKNSTTNQALLQIWHELKNNTSATAAPGKREASLQALKMLGDAQSFVDAAKPITANIMSLVAADDKEGLAEVLKKSSSDVFTHIASDEALKLIQAMPEGAEKDQHLNAISLAKCVAALSTSQGKSPDEIQAHLKNELSEILKQPGSQFVLNDAISLLPDLEFKIKHKSLVVLLDAAVQTKEVDKSTSAFQLAEFFDPDPENGRQMLFDDVQTVKGSPEEKYLTTEHTKRAIIDEIKADRKANVQTLIKKIATEGTGDPYKALTEVLNGLKEEVENAYEGPAIRTTIQKYSQVAQMALTAWEISKEIKLPEGTLSEAFFKTTMGRLVKQAESQGISSIPSFKAAFKALTGVNQEQKDQMAHSVYSQLLKRTGLGTNKPNPEAMQKVFLELLENKLDVETILEVTHKGLDQTNPENALKNRAFAREQLHIAKVAYAIMKNNDGLFQLETAGAGQGRIAAAEKLLKNARAESITAAKIKLYTTKGHITRPLAEAIQNRNSGALLQLLAEGKFTSVEEIRKFAALDPQKKKDDFDFLKNVSDKYVYLHLLLEDPEHNKEQILKHLASLKTATTHPIDLFSAVLTSGIDAKAKTVFNSFLEQEFANALSSPNTDALKSLLSQLRTVNYSDESVNNALQQQISLLTSPELKAAFTAVFDEHQALLSLHKDLKEAIVSNDTKKMNDLYARAVNGKVDLGRLYNQVMSEIAQADKSETFSLGLATFFKANIQAAAIAKQNDHLQKLFAFFPDLQTIGLQGTPQQLVKEAITDMKKNQSPPDAISFMERVDANFDAIKSVPYERHRMHPLDMFRMAIFAEDQIQKTGQREDVLYLSGKTTGLPRAILIDFKSHAFSILSKKFGELQALGTYKKVSDVVKVSGTIIRDPSGAMASYSAQGRRFVAATSRAGKTIDPKEIGFERKYADLTMMTVYASSKRPDEQKRIYIQEAYDSDLEKTLKTLPPEELIPQIISFMPMITATLSKMHLNENIDEIVVHRDLKLGNIIARKDGDRWVVRVADFGLSLNLTTDSVTVGYGTTAFTSPEYVKQKGYSKILQKESSEAIVKQWKADDMFALGCLLWEAMHPGENVPWVDDTFACMKAELHNHNVRKEVVKILDNLEAKIEEAGDDAKTLRDSISDKLKNWIGNTDALIAAYKSLSSFKGTAEELLPHLETLNENLVEAKRLEAVSALDTLAARDDLATSKPHISSLKAKVMTGTIDQDQVATLLQTITSKDVTLPEALEKLDKTLVDATRENALSALRSTISGLTTKPKDPKYQLTAKDKLELICAQLLEEDPEKRLTIDQLEKKMAEIAETAKL